VTPSFSILLLQLFKCILLTVYSLSVVCVLSLYLGMAQIRLVLSWASSVATQHWSRPTVPARRSWSTFTPTFQLEGSSFSTFMVQKHTCIHCCLSYKYAPMYSRFSLTHMHTQLEGLLYLEPTLFHCSLQRNRSCLNITKCHIGL